MYKIYMHKNKINGKVYIGQTCTSLEERFGKNGIRYKGSTYFYNAIQKYGWDNFEHIILEDNINDSYTANDKEIYYIRLYINCLCLYSHLKRLHISYEELHS